MNKLKTMIDTMHESVLNDTESETHLDNRIIERDAELDYAEYRSNIPPYSSNNSRAAQLRNESYTMSSEDDDLKTQMPDQDGFEEDDFEIFNKCKPRI